LSKLPTSAGPTVPAGFRGFAFDIREVMKVARGRGD